MQTSHEAKRYNRPNEPLVDWGSEDTSFNPQSGEVPEFLGDEATGSVNGTIITGSQRLKMAKTTLTIIGVGYFLLCLLVIALDPGMTDRVWTFSAYLVNNAVVLMLGFYFGRHPP